MQMFFGSIKTLAFCVMVASACAATQSQAADPLLTVTPAAGQAEVIALTREQLEVMPATTFRTTTTWTDGVRTFTGVALKDLLHALSLEGDVLRATALNDYSVDIPTSDAVQGGPIVAYLIDHQPFSVRDKGPLWIVYPYDSSADYQTEVIYSRSIWQLDRIEMID